MTKGKYEKTAQRIKELVEVKCGGSQQRFAEAHTERTGQA